MNDTTYDCLVIAITDRWIGNDDRRRVTALAGLETAPEQPVSALRSLSTNPRDAAPELTFVYSTYIRTTPAEPW